MRYAHARCHVAPRRRYRWRPGSFGAPLKWIVILLLYFTIFALPLKPGWDRRAKFEQHARAPLANRAGQAQSSGAARPA